MQSFVIHPKFVSNDLLTVECLEELKTNLPVGHQFLTRTSFDPCVDVSRHAWGTFLRVSFVVTLPITLVKSRGGHHIWLLGGHPRGVLSGAASIADPVSLAEVSETMQASTSSSVQRMEERPKNGHRQEKSC